MSSLKIAIPLYHGIKGSLTEYFYSRNGKLVDKNTYWIVPIAVYMTDGTIIKELRIVDRMHIYQGEFEFVVWDKLNQATAKKVATIKINSINDSYEVAVEERYIRYRNVMEFNMIQSNNVPSEQLAYLNNTPHGDWIYKDRI